MRSNFGTLSLAALSVLALAACGGGSSAPPTTNPTSAPTASPTAHSSATASPTSSPTSAPTTVAQTWTLQSCCVTLSLTAGQTPAQIQTETYSTTEVVQFTAPSQSGTLVYSVSLPAAGQIATPNTLPADNATSGFTPQAYFSFYNGGTQAISFGQNIPEVIFAATPSGATTCALDVLNSSASSWTQVATGSVAPGTYSTNQVIIGPATLPAGSSVNFQPGQQIVAVSCN